MTRSGASVQAVRGRAVAALAFLFLASCTASGPPGARPSGAPRSGARSPGALVPPTAETRNAATIQLLNQLDVFHVSGAIRTSEGLLLPETITIEIKSEVCVESRRPGSRFWTLDYDTCFAFSQGDTVDAKGEYSLRVPCLDADRTYESRHGFGDLRLVQRGPVSFVADSDAGWKHQETFTSSRSQRRDLVLTLETEVFWVVRGDAPFRERARSGAAAFETYAFGTPVDVVRFHQGWAQIRMGRRIGWMEMRYLGTEEDMKEKAPFKGKPAAKPPRSDSGEVPD